MDSSHIALLIALVILVTLSAYFSATETAFSSLNPIRLKNLAAGGNKRAALALSLSENYDRLLSTILIGNNIVNITSASLATVLFVAWLPRTGVTASTVVMTVVVLIFGEISPKSLTKDAPESFAMFSAPILAFFIRLLAPLNFLFMQWKRLLSRFFKAPEDRGITGEELLTIVEEARQDGGIGDQEGELIRHAIEWRGLDAGDILTPRVDVAAVRDTEPAEAIDAVFLETGYSRLPVYHGTIDHIVGILHQKDFYSEVLRAGKPLGTVLHAPVLTPPSLGVGKVLKLLQQSHSHLAVVADEYGGTMGIVTMEDILEELVGEIWDEHDEAVDEITPLGTGVYAVQCATRLEKLFDVLHLGGAPEEIATVGGWIVSLAGRIPQAGQCVQYGGVDFTVTKADGRRIHEVQARVRPACAPDGPPPDDA